MRDTGLENMSKPIAHTRRILKTAHVNSKVLDVPPTQVLLKADMMITGEGRFFVDTGADINLVRSDKLHPRTRINRSEIVI